MNNNLEEAKELFEKISSEASKTKGLDRVLVFPPYPYLIPLMELNSK